MPETSNFTTLLPPPNGYLVDLNHPQRQGIPQVYWAYGVGTVCSVLFVAQRVYTKLVIIGKTQLDDVFLLLAWVSCQGGLPLAVYMFAQGACGIHGWELSLEKYNLFLLLLYIITPLYFLASGCGKISILIFYVRLSPERWFVRLGYVSLFIMSGYTISVIFSLIFACNPISLSWTFDPAVTGECINVRALYIIFAALNITSDVMLFCLPLPVIYKVRIHRTQKLGLLFVFFLGSFTCVTSIIRIVFLPGFLRSTDPTWDVTWIMIWAMAEANLLVICASLPTIHKFVTHMAPRLIKGSSYVRSADAVGDNVELNGIETIGRKGKVGKHKCRTDWAECTCIRVQTVIENSHDVHDGHRDGNAESLPASTSNEGLAQDDGCESKSLEQDGSSRVQLL